MVTGQAAASSSPGRRLRQTAATSQISMTVTPLADQACLAVHSPCCSLAELLCLETRHVAVEEGTSFLGSGVVLKPRQAMRVMKECAECLQLLGCVAGPRLPQFSRLKTLQYRCTRFLHGTSSAAAMPATLFY